MVVKDFTKKHNCKHFSNQFDPRCQKLVLPYLKSPFFYGLKLVICCLILAYGIMIVIQIFESLSFKNWFYFFVCLKNSLRIYFSGVCNFKCNEKNCNFIKLVWCQSNNLFNMKASIYLYDVFSLSTKSHSPNSIFFWSRNHIHVRKTGHFQQFIGTHIHHGANVSLGNSKTVVKSKIL